MSNDNTLQTGSVESNGVHAETLVVDGTVSVGPAPSIEAYNALQAENDALKKTLIETLAEQSMKNLVFFPALFTQKQRGSLAQKYALKYAKFKAEIALHQNTYPAYANDTAMLYVLTQMAAEADAKSAADARDGHISNLYTMVTGYTLAEVLTEYQAKKNSEVDREIKELAEKIGEDHRERVNILKAVRKYWLASFDVGHKDTMDRKIRRACHILGVAIQELE